MDFSRCGRSRDLAGLVRYDEARRGAHQSRASGHRPRHERPCVARISLGGQPIGRVADGRAPEAEGVERSLRYPSYIRAIFRAMQTYGLIVADNGSDMYITGAMDSRWNNGELNPAFRSLTAGDFEVIQLGGASRCATGKV